jgi:hypothetical protein
MYYNLTEDEKVFYETSYSLLKAGYTNEEIVEFWSNDNEEEVEFILESLEYVDINRKDPDFIELNEGALKVIQYGSRAWQGLKTAAKFVTNPITRNLALRSRNAAKIKELAALTNPTPAQRNLYNTLAKRLPNAAKKNPTKWQPDKLTQVRPGSSTYRPTPEPTPVAAPAPAAASPPAAPVTPKTPVGPKIKNTLITTGVGVGLGVGLINNRAGDVPVVKPTEVKPTETKVEPTEVKTPEVKPRKTDPDKKADQDNFTSDGSEIKIGDEVGGPEFARPAPKNTAPETRVPQTRVPQTQVTPEVKKPSRKKERFSFGTYDRSRQSRDGVTGGVNNSYEYAIDKLISEGHASSIEEAEYVFKQLDDDFIKAFIS